MYRGVSRGSTETGPEVEDALLLLQPIPKEEEEEGGGLPCVRPALECLILGTARRRPGPWCSIYGGAGERVQRSGEEGYHLPLVFLWCLPGAYQWQPPRPGQKSHRGFLMPVWIQTRSRERFY
uniref:Uncharacterized protein n=1 Tax=Knipowitschia caucasica TaxID=637954 RepID=A0AAV2KJ40_KNICA